MDRRYELYHHGIKGMRWGIRRFQDKNGRLTQAGKKRYSEDDRNDAEETESKKGMRLTDKQKKYIKIGAAAAATALVAYGGYKLYKSGKLGGVNSNVDIPAAKSFGLKKKTKLGSIEADLKAVNPHYNAFDPNYSRNCGNCSFAFEMRRRGYDVTALGNPDGMKISHVGQFFSGLKSESFIQMNVTDSIMSSKPNRQRGKEVQDLISSNISKAYDGDARGSLFFPHTYGSHWINWVKEGDSVKFYDGQNPKIDLVNDLFAYYKYHPNNINAGLTSIRLDDLDINPSITQMVANVGVKNNAKFDTFIDKGENFVTKWYNT